MAGKAAAGGEPSQANEGKDGGAGPQSGPGGGPSGRGLRWMRVFRIALVRVRRLVQTSLFSSLTRRIVFLNLASIAILVGGILFLNQYREGLIDARIDSLFAQGEIMAAAVAASAQVRTDGLMVDPDELLRQQAQKPVTQPRPDDGDMVDFTIDPEQIAPVLVRLTTPTHARARVFDRDGSLVIDSNLLYTRGQEALRFDPAETDSHPELAIRIFRQLRYWLRHGTSPPFDENEVSSVDTLPEVVTAIQGATASITRLNTHNELIVSVAVPIRRSGAVVGALQLSTQGGDIDAITDAENLGILRVALMAAAVTVLSSIAMAGTIASPLRRLAAAADRVRRGSGETLTLPALFERSDEVGHLALSLRDMTEALFTRMGAIERFAADVAHELKNPLTSLRSAVETLPLARSDISRERLLGIIQHDVRRLDRLISDISDASRLDAELAREQIEIVDLERLVSGVAALQNEIRINKFQGAAAEVVVVVDPADRTRLRVLGHEGRLGQVLVNILENARSFSPPDAEIIVRMGRAGEAVLITIDDRGPGIRAEAIERIFERFYTDRPDSEGFGNNSGLGLSISRQIVEAHRGRIAASNREDPESPGGIAGARFTIELPAEDA